MLSMRSNYFKHLQKNWCLLKEIKGCNSLPILSSDIFSPGNTLYMSTTAKNPPKAVRTVKVFQPALSDSDFAKVETEERESHPREEVPPMPKFQKIRKLGKLDKLLLVSVGKYKNISEDRKSVV